MISKKTITLSFVFLFLQIVSLYGMGYHTVHYSTSEGTISESSICYSNVVSKSFLESNLQNMDGTPLSPGQLFDLQQVVWKINDFYSTVQHYITNPTHENVLVGSLERIVDAYHNFNPNLMPRNYLHIALGKPGYNLLKRFVDPEKIFSLVEKRYKQKQQQAIPVSIIQAQKPAQVEVPVVTQSELPVVIESTSPTIVPIIESQYKKNLNKTPYIIQRL